MDLLIFNKHWRENFFYQISFKRVYYNQLLELIDSKFILNLYGLRRVGKTTLMKQFIDYLIIEKNINRNHILFYSFDNFGQIDDIINEYFKISGLDKFKDIIYIFFDEIQKIKDWQSKVKIYYDNFPNFKFIISGSSSLYLTKKESLAGRIIEKNIKPLFFDEYLEFKGKKDYLKNTGLFKSEIISEFDKYLSRQFIDIVNENDDIVYEYIINLKNKIIKEDIITYFKIEYPDIIDKIFRIISSNPGMLLDYKNFSNDIDIDQRTLEKYIFYLQESFLIKKIYNYSNNLIKSERKLKKIYLGSTSFITNKNKYGEIFENFIVNTYDFDYFYRLGNMEVDFIHIDKFGDIFPIEVKYKEKINTNDTKGIIHFTNKFKTKKSLIISKNQNLQLNGIDIKAFYTINITSFLSL